MPNNLLTKFADNASTSYSEGVGLRYTDSYWQGGGQGPSVHDTGFIPNTPISPIQMNTLFSQTTMCSYILGEVLASSILVNKSGEGLVEQSQITSEQSQGDVQTNYVQPLVDFLNRINQISGNDGDGSESVWRSRQVGSGDIGNYWYTDSTGYFRPINTKQRLLVNYIYSVSTGTHIALGARTASLYAPTFDLNANTNLTGTLSVSNGLTVEGNMYMNENSCISSGNCFYLGTPTSIDSTTSNIDRGHDAIFRMRTRYNTGGESENTTYYTRNLEDILYDIGTRLDNLGFSEGTVTIYGRTIGSSSSPTIRRQGNYCYVSVDTTINFNSNPGIAINDTAIVLPTGFTPAENLTNITIMILDIDSVFGSSYTVGALDICTMSSGRNEIIRSQYVMPNSMPTWNGTYRVICNFGYQAQPR